MKKMIEIIIGGLVLLLCLILFFLGFQSVPEEKRYLVEVFGKYHRTLNKGLHWLFPGIEKIRASVSVWEQRYQLFQGPIKIDFRNGSATPKDAIAYVQMNPQDPEAPYKMVYNVKNLKEAVVTLLENALRSYLNSLTVEEGIEMGRAGYDLFGKIKNHQNEEIRNQAEDIERALASWGLILHRVTIGDFDLDPTIIEARERVLKAQREAEAAKSIAQQEAWATIGAVIAMRAQATGKPLEAVKAEIANNPHEMASVTALIKELIFKKMAIDAGAYRDWNFNVGLNGLDITQLLNQFLQRSRQ